MKRILRYIGYTLLGVVSLYLGLGLMGGGWGPKEHASSIGAGPIHFAHRGAHTSAPENSDGALQAAVEAGFKGVEVDLRMAGDKQLYLFHDENANRLLGVDATFSEMDGRQVAGANLHMNGEPTEERVIFLEEALSNYTPDLAFYLDVKHTSDNADGKIYTILKKHRALNKAMVASTSAWFVCWAEFNYPEMNTVLEGFNAGKEWMYKFIPTNFRPDHLSSFADEVDKQHVEWLREKDLLKHRVIYGVGPATTEPSLEEIPYVIVDSK